VPPADTAADEEPVATLVEPAAAAEAGADPEVSDDGQPKRKRSRRGSRGGRKRRKPTTNGEQVEPEAADAPAELGLSGTGGGGALAGVSGVVAGPPAPEYVPMSEWIGDFDPRSEPS